jgi:hypothetical protein
MTSYSGYLVAVPRIHEFQPDELERRSPEATGGPTLTHVNSRVFNMPRWDNFQLATTVPLTDEARDQPSYQYPVFIIRGLSKLIILAHRRRIADFIITRILDRQIFPKVRKVSIFVEPMIEHCRRSDADYLITSLHGRFSGPATDLKSISLYGDDVTRSGIYADHHDLFNFHSAGLGRRIQPSRPPARSVEDGAEIVRLASDGFVSVNLGSRQRAIELTKVIAFVTSNRWVEEWVPSPTGSDL